MLTKTIGEVSTLAGSQQGFADGNGRAAKFSTPNGICFEDNSRSLLVCDWGNNKLRRVQLNGTLSYPPPCYLFLGYLIRDAGEVTTLCDIPVPFFVAVTANHTILVTSIANTLYKVTHQGTPTKFTHCIK